jgi:dephospho-CoA kinase
MEIVMKVIGLTGGIGSGKSLVAKILKEKYGAYILYTDNIAKEQMEPGGASFKEVVEYFGDIILAPDGTIDRGKLAAIIFEDQEKRLKINEITHPKVLAAVEAEINRVRAQAAVPYLVVETALMLEAGYDFICDEVWYVHTPEKVRRLRLKKERSYSDEKIDTIFANQSKEEAFRAKFTKVIENIGDIEMLEKQVDLLINK